MLTVSVVGLLLLVAGLVALRTVTKKLSEVEAEVRQLRQRLQATSDLLELTNTSAVMLTSHVAELRFPEFGPYAFAMSSYPFPGRGIVPGYLPLLYLCEAEQIVASVYSVQKAHRRDVVNRSIVGLLAEPLVDRQRLSWEPHLVASVALVANQAAGPCSDEVLALVWARVRDSWVSPQLLAAASIVDPDFDVRASACVADRVHPKALTALLALISDREAAERLAQDSWVAEAAARDLDGGADIATAWRSSVLRATEAARRAPEAVASERSSGSTS